MGVIGFKVVKHSGTPLFFLFYPLSCHPKVPLPSPLPVPLTFIGPKFGWHHGNQGSQGTLPGLNPRCLQGGTGWCCLRQRAVTTAGCYNKASFALACHGGIGSACWPLISNYQLAWPVISCVISHRSHCCGSLRLKHGGKQGKQFTSTHIDVAWLGAQCCLPHERTQERERDMRKKRARKTALRCIFNV